MADNLIPAPHPDSAVRDRLARIKELMETPQGRFTLHDELMAEADRDQKFADNPPIGVPELTLIDVKASVERKRATARRILTEGKYIT